MSKNDQAHQPEMELSTTSPSKSEESACKLMYERMKDQMTKGTSVTGSGHLNDDCKKTSLEDKSKSANHEKSLCEHYTEQIGRPSINSKNRWEQTMPDQIDGILENSLSDQRHHIINTHKRILKKTFRKLREEMKRVGLNSKLWRCSTANKNFSLCPTYPPYLIVPAQVSDEELFEVARYRHVGRIPSVVWRCRKNGAVLVRSSQPSVGLLGRRSGYDERLLGAILESCIYDDLDDDEFFEINVCNQEHSFDKNGKPKDNSICSHNYCDNCINHCFSEHRQASNSTMQNETLVDHHDRTNETKNKTNDKDSEESEDNESLQMQSTNTSDELNDSLNHLRLESATECESIESESQTEPSNVDSETNAEDSDDLDKPNLESNHSCLCDCHENIRKSRSESNVQAAQSSDRNKDKRLLILDARSFTVAFFNRAMGGGSECAEYYPNCDVDYLYLANIHSVRSAFLNLRSLCETNGVQSPSYFVNWSKINNNYWLYYLSNLIESALKIVTAVNEEGRPVLVHCSDGWDRTPQLISLAQIMMDSNFRTIKGFQRLIQKEWLEFGHKFADRCGLFPLSKNVHERSPIFLQWLDCVHQLVKQFPDWFEFNLSYLEGLAFHTYSPLFGTFYCNNYLERFINRIYGKSNSVWACLDSSRDKFINTNYIETDKVMKPVYDVSEMILWKELYSNLINEEFLSRFELKSGSSSSSTKETGPPIEDCNFIRRRRLFRAVSLDYIDRQIQNEKELKQNCGLRRFKSEPCLRPTTAGRTLAQFRTPFVSKRVKCVDSKNNENGGGEGENNEWNTSGNYRSPLSKSANTSHLDGGLASGSPNGRLQNSNRLSTSSLCTPSGSCEFESGSGSNNANGDNFVESECFQNQVPLSVISKIAQVANGNPDSSLMYSILSYVSSLYTFSVK